MLAAIRSVYREHDDDRQLEVYNAYLGMRDRRTRFTEPRLTLNRTNEESFQRWVVDHAPTDELTEARRGKTLAPSDVLLLKAHQFIRDAITQKTRATNSYETFLLDLEEFIRDRIVLILVAVGDEADAYLIFETLNDRGLELSISDLLKNYIYGKAGSRLSAVQKQWEEMILLLGTQDATQFLRHYWLSQYGVVRERDLYRELRRRFASQQKVLSLMSELRAAADKYAAMSNVDHPIWKGYPSQLRRDLETLQLFGLTQFRPLLLAALQSLDEEEIPKIVRLVAVVSMRYSIIGSLGTGNLERAYSDAAIHVRGGGANTAAKIFALLKGIYPDNDRFAADFANKAIAKPKLARYILAGLANAIQPGRELGVVEDERKVTLEHIMPKTMSEEWRRAANDEAEYLAYVDRLGNTTLIERDANRAAGNAGFAQKKTDAFSQSDIAMTTELCSFDEWTIAEVASRQRELAKTATEVWTLPY